MDFGFGEVVLGGAPLHVYDEVPFGREKSLFINLHDPVTVLLKEFQNPSVKVVPLIRYIVFDEARRQNE